MLEKIILPILIVIYLLLPSSTPPHEIPLSYYQPKTVSSLSLAPLKEFAPLAFQPFPFLPMGSRASTYAPGNCTWGAASMKPNVPESWGNANTWDDSARASGITVSDTPIKGAVAETDRGYYGHVAVVTDVEADGTAVITEMNYDSNGGVRTREAAPGEFNYIYL